MPDAARRFARRVFTGAAVYGLLALLPQYFLEDRLNRDFPPAITHPEHFYGFVGIALAWQFAFLVIARDPVRYRALMPVAILEKLAFGGAAVVLFALGRLAWPVLAVGIVDLVLAALFLAAWRATPRAAGMLP
jgi:hypothetical protein